MSIPTYTLNDGRALPAIGLGTYGLDDAAGVEAMTDALGAGYRLLDTAVSYGNEEQVGEAVRRSGLPRDEILVTSKVPGRDHRYDDAIRSTRGSLARLGLDHLDLHLIHWPNPSDGRYPETWRALVDMQRDGLVTSIGVCNFKEHHLRRIIDDSGVPPVVNQVELHPWFPQADLRAVHDQLGILTESWSPLGKREAPFEEAPVRDAAAAHRVSPAQVVLRWQLQLGNLPIPKSAHPERQRQNLDVFGFALTDEEMQAITGLGRSDGRLFGGDPDIHEER